MVKKLISFVILIFAGVVLFLFFGVNRKTAPVSNMKIASLMFQNNTKIPSIYTCDGKNINPPLEFVQVPTNAKSLALIVDDPDAPSKIWVHWVIYNINPKVAKVDENSIPQDGIEGVTDFGNKGYGGPCPPASPKLPPRLGEAGQRGEPSGTHRYFFKLYALDIILHLQNATKEIVEQKMQNHILEKAELMGLYKRDL